MNPLSIIGLGAGLIGGIGQLFGTSKSNKQLQALQAQNDALANERLGLARTLLNGKMPGSAEMERNIFTNQANTVGNLQRNATSANELLLGGAGAQTQTNDALNKLGIEEQQDYQRRYGNLQDAQQAKLASLEADAQLEGAQRANNYNTWGNIANMGFGIANLGMMSGTNGLFGKGSTTPLSHRIDGAVPTSIPNVSIPNQTGLYGNSAGVYVNPDDLNFKYNGYGSDFWLPR